MMDSESGPSVLELTDELLVASTLLAMMEAPKADLSILREMCVFSIKRCQDLTAKMVWSDRRDG